MIFFFESQSKHDECFCPVFYSVLPHTCYVLNTRDGHGAVFVDAVGAPGQLLALLIPSSTLMYIDKVRAPLVGHSRWCLHALVLLRQSQTKLCNCASRFKILRQVRTWLKEAGILLWGQGDFKLALNQTARRVISRNMMNHYFLLAYQLYNSDTFYRQNKLISSDCYTNRV